MAHISDTQGMATGMMKEMMGPGKMNSKMMKAMMGPGEIMGSGTGREATRGTAKIVVVAIGSGAKQSFFGKLIQNPVVLIGAGIVAGYLIHKYRKEIISEK